MSYRKTVISARRDQKKGRTGGLTEEQKQVGQTPGVVASRALPARCWCSRALTLLLDSSLQEIREAFDLFDTDGSGTIDAKVRSCWG